MQPPPTPLSGLKRLARGSKRCIYYLGRGVWQPQLFSCPRYPRNRVSQNAALLHTTTVPRPRVSPCPSLSL
jgi:hypothetical protein